MFRRMTSSPGKIHYRVNINKNMCLGVVDIYIDGKPYQPGFNGSYLDIYRDKKIKTISISGQISYLNPKDLCSGCESYAYGKSSHGNYRVTVRIV